MGESLDLMGFSLIFHIDVSGQPSEEIYVGLSSIKVGEMSKFIKKLKRDRPEFLRNNFKGSKLRSNQIRSYMNYFNGQKIWMRNIRLKSSYWKELKNYLENKKYWKEIVYACLYFIALKKYSVKHDSHPVSICPESYLDIEKVGNFLKKLGKAHSINYQISVARAKQNEMIKVSDIVASAGRKLRHIKLNLDFYETICPNLETLKFYIKKMK